MKCCILKYLLNACLLCFVDPSDLCLEAKLEQFGHSAETFDVIINHSPVFPLEKFYLPYVGV